MGVGVAGGFYQFSTRFLMKQTCNEDGKRLQDLKEEKRTFEKKNIYDVVILLNFGDGE